MPNLLVSATTRYDPKGLNKAKKHISGFEKTIKTLGKTFASVFAAQKVLQFGKASVQAFMADEKAARSLSNTLKMWVLNTLQPMLKILLENYKKPPACLMII